MSRKGPARHTHVADDVAHAQEENHADDVAHAVEVDPIPSPELGAGRREECVPYPLGQALRGRFPEGI